MPRVSNAQTQAVDMQRKAYKAAEMLSNDLESTNDKELRTRITAGLSQAIKSWELLQNSLRIMRGKPLPGSLRPIAKPSKAKRSHAHQHVIEAPEQGTIASEKESPSTTGATAPPPPVGGNEMGVDE